MDYVLDRAVSAALGLFCIIGSVVFVIKKTSFGSIGFLVWCLWIIVSIASWIVLFGRIILLLHDYLIGIAEKTVYFSGVAYCEKGIAFSHKKYENWGFYDFSNSLLLTVPYNVYNKYKKINKPFTDQKIKISYYRRSRILIGWEPVSE